MSLIFISIVFLQQSRAHSSHRRAALHSPATSSSGSSTPRKYQTHAVITRAEFALHSTGIPAMVQPSLRQQERCQGVCAVAVVMATKKHSVSDKDVAKPRAYCTLRMATPEYSVLHCDVPSVDQLHSLQARVRAGPVLPPSLSGPQRTNAERRGVAAESIAGNVLVLLLLAVLVAVLALTMRRLVAFRSLTGSLRR